MADFPIYETWLCELVGLAGGLGLGLVVGYEFGWAGRVVGVLLGVTVAPICARLPRLRRNFVTVFDVFEAIGVLCGLAYGVSLGGDPKVGLLARIVVATIGALAGWFCVWLPCFLWECYLRLKLTTETTDALRAWLRDREWWPMYQRRSNDERLILARFQLSAKWPKYALVMRELRKRGEEARSELPLVLTLLGDERWERRHHGWQMLRALFPELAAKIPDYGPLKSAADCRAKLDSIRPAAT